MNNKIPSIHPGEILQEEFLPPLNITAYKLAKETFLDQTRISEILKAKRSVNAAPSCPLCLEFDISLFPCYP